MHTVKIVRVAKWALALPVFIALTGMTANSLNTDKSIELGFARALSGSGGLNTADAAVSGSEDFWLRQPSGKGHVAAADVERVVWRGPVAAGGTFVVGSGSDRKEFEVISIEQHEPSATRIDMTASASNPMRVQARDGAKSGAPAIWFELLTHAETPVADAASSAPGGTPVDRAL